MALKLQIDIMITVTYTH